MRISGTAEAMRAMGNLQLDPHRLVARAQDLALHSRVIRYREDGWARLTYEDRTFFEWGDFAMEVYTKAEKRRFGYYVLPMLWGDRLVGRIEFKVERPAGRLVEPGRWFEAGVDPKARPLVAAIDRAIDRLRTLVA